MLNPNDRKTYLEELKPPEGYRLDCAIATTFSLDLISLLQVPVAMALQNVRAEEGVVDDPLALLEAIERTSDRFVVFCQHGRISVPKRYTSLFTHLESAVVEAKAKHREGVFHPKIWFMRFVNPDDSSNVLYRFICMTRNLTFDRSWDTALVLEGNVAMNRRRGYGVNRPLGRFVEALPSLAVRRVSQKVSQLVKTIADEVKRVRFSTPDGFNDDYRFLPIGIPGHKRLPTIEAGRKTLVISPFLSPNVLRRLMNNGGRNTIVSRPDSLNAIPIEVLKKLLENTDAYVMDAAAEISDEYSEGDSAELADINDLRGLHAKLVVIENGRRVRLLTGSANTTEAAFSGRNVEFMVELNSTTRNAGVDRLVGEAGERYTFRSLLQPYSMPETSDSANSNMKKIERRLEISRRHLADAGIRMSVASTEDDLFTMKIECSQRELKLPGGVKCRCYPVSLPEAASKPLARLIESGSLSFKKITAEALTTYVAFELTGRLKSDSLGISFVLNLPAANMPTDRKRRILRHILKNRDRFVRYLMMLLGADITVASPQEENKSGKKAFGVHGSPWGIPLLEEMVRAFSRDREKIARVERLVKELKSTGEIDDVFPEGFDNVWKAFKKAQNLEGLT